MNRALKHRNAVWAFLFVARDSSIEMADFFLRHGLSRKHLKKQLHLTIYHARRKLPELEAFSRNVQIVIPTIETRFMVLAPGGERPRPDIDQERYPIGVRIRRQARKEINDLRLSLMQFETFETVRGRQSTSLNSNAFGARHYQPHLTVLSAGALDGRNLKDLGRAFRSELSEIRFDRFQVKCRYDRISDDN